MPEYQKGLKVKMKKKNYNKNIWINYIFTALKNLSITQGIWMIFLVSKGLSLFEVGMLEGIFHITSFIMETPTGVVADVFGRKISRLIGVIMSILSSVLILISTGFWGYAIAFVVSALSYNFESGANEALVYDSLILEKKESLYIKIAGNIEVIMQLISVASLLLGGIIANYSYEWTYIVSIFLAFISILFAAMFIEPKIGYRQKIKFKKAITQQYINCFSAIKENKKLLYLITFTSTLSTFVTLSFYYLQIAWKSNQFTPAQIGIFLSISSICGAVGGLIAVRVDAKFGERIILKYSPLLMIVIVLFYFLKISIIAFAFVSFVDSIIYVTTRNYINKLISSERRATILSFESTLFSLFMICIFPIFGLISDNIGLSNAFLILGITIVVLNINNIIFNRKLLPEGE